jgi:hypothetical protein
LPEVVLNSVLNEALYYVAIAVSITVEAALPHNSEWRNGENKFVCRATTAEKLTYHE